MIKTRVKKLNKLMYLAYVIPFYHKLPLAEVAIDKALRTSTRNTENKSLILQVVDSQDISSRPPEIS